ncbi:MAG: DinB superfamily protein [Nocardioidaceae bacterium]|nr:DinB superfamily protein [Nocardioidaceae bacterium]
MVADPKSTLVDYLTNAREAMLLKLDGLDEYDVRRPMTPTGTNLLGMVKHLTGTELGYFGDTFGRPGGMSQLWEADDVDPEADMWAAADETREEIVGHYRAAIAHAAETIALHDLDAVGQVPWWPAGRREVTLHQVLVHMVAETCRHAGHADVLRESLDGAVGRFRHDEGMPDVDWPEHVARVEQAARSAAGR